MADRSQLRQPPGVVASVLLICIVAGLLAGVGTSKLVTGLTNAAHLGQDGLGSNGAHRHVTPTSTPRLLPSPTATEATSKLTNFTVEAQVSPASVAPGKQFTITATVIAKDGVTPLGGVLCTLGGTLFTQWPAGKVSSANGKATWTLQAPSVPKGAYSIKVSATATDWSYYNLVSVTITA